MISTLCGGGHLGYTGGGNTNILINVTKSNAKQNRVVVSTTLGVACYQPERGLCLKLRFTSYLDQNTPSMVTINKNKTISFATFTIDVTHSVVL